MNGTKMKWKIEEIDYLVKNYEKNGVEFCANFLNRNDSSVKHKANRLGLIVEKNVTNNIKSEKVKNSWLDRNDVENNLLKKLKTDLSNINKNMAYVLGYLWGDGYVYDGGIGKKNFVNLEIIKEDGEEIKNILLSIFDWNIYYRKRNNRKETIKFEINNRLLIEFFCSFDYTKKSFVSPDKILEIIPDKQKKYFFLGLSDADGSFYFNDNGTYQYHISSTIGQDWSYIEKLFNILGIKYKISHREQISKDGNISHHSIIRISYKKGVVKLGDYLYSGKIKGLNRKYIKYLKIKHGKNYLRFCKLERILKSKMII